jgi:hypothetical protein
MGQEEACVSSYWVSASLRAYFCVCVSRVCSAVFSRWRHQRNRINSVTGRLAQLVERTLSMREVEGSKPSLSTTFVFVFLYFLLRLLLFLPFISLSFSLLYFLRIGVWSIIALFSISSATFVKYSHSYRFRQQYWTFTISSTYALSDITVNRITKNDIISTHQNKKLIIRHNMDACHASSMQEKRVRKGMRSLEKDMKEKRKTKTKVVDNEGFDPSTSRMLSVRSTNWASRPVTEFIRFRWWRHRENTALHTLDTQTQKYARNDALTALFNTYHTPHTTQRTIITYSIETVHVFHNDSSWSECIKLNVDNLSYSVTTLHKL